jgi:hypothetical protein
MILFQRLPVHENIRFYMPLSKVSNIANSCQDSDYRLTRAMMKEWGRVNRSEKWSRVITESPHEV